MTNQQNQMMMKKGIATLLLILVVCVGAYFAYDFYNKGGAKNNIVVQPQTQNNPTNTAPKTPARAPITAEQQTILDAAVARMSKAMESKDAKKIKVFMLSLYPDKADQDPLKKLSDSQLLQSAQYFKDFDMAKSLSASLATLPDSAWVIGSSTASITQVSPDGHRAVFTATKVKGVWQ